MKERKRGEEWNERGEEGEEKRRGEEKMHQHEGATTR